MLFMTYIYERLGAQALLDFATHSRQGLDALDALLAERAAGIDADDFFADWALANYLADGERENGRFGYSRLSPREHTFRAAQCAAPAADGRPRLVAALRQRLP